jgi:hypothetical protein
MPTDLGVSLQVLGVLDTSGELRLTTAEGSQAHTTACDTLVKAWRTPLYEARRSFKAHTAL